MKMQSTSAIALNITQKISHDAQYTPAFWMVDGHVLCAFAISRRILNAKQRGEYGIKQPLKKHGCGNWIVGHKFQERDIVDWNGQLEVVRSKGLCSIQLLVSYKAFCFGGLCQIRCSCCSFLKLRQLNSIGAGHTAR